jgi:methylmalonyl-CoA mutase
MILVLWFRMLFSCLHFCTFGGSESIEYMTESTKMNPREIQFETATPDIWKALIEKELKGISYDKVQTRTMEGLVLDPFYMPEVEKDIPYLQHAEWYSFIRNLQSAPLHIRQTLIPSDISELQQASDVMPFHAGFTGFSAEAFSEAIQRLPIASIDIRDYFTESLKQEIQKAGLPGTASWNLEDLPIHPDWPENFRPYGFRADLYHYRGADAVQEIAYILHDMISWIDKATRLGMAVADAVNRIHFRFALGPDLFLSLAQIRAFRALYYRVIGLYGIEDISQPCILTENSLRYHAEVDRHNNLLRSGTAAMAAMMTGSYSFEAWPFSSREKRNFALRMSRNMIHLMRSESYIDKTRDPVGGAWYLESYTYSLYLKAMEMLQSLESIGDASAVQVKVLKNSQIDNSANLRREAADTGKLKLLGVNIFPNPKESQSLQFNLPGVPQDIVRLAAPYEALMEQGRSLPGYSLHLISPVSACQARIDFIQQFMATCGIPFTEDAGSLIILCGTDSDYTKAETLEWIQDQSRTATIVLAGAPADSKTILEQAGIKRMITLNASRIEAARFFHSILNS